MFCKSLILSVGATLVATSAVHAQFALTWTSIDGGGATVPATGGTFTLAGTAGQPDAGSSSAGSFACISGFWGAALEGSACYANCDNSSAPPILNALDFGCFLSKFAAGDAYANCDASTSPPILNSLDFGCFLSKFAAGCT